MAHKSFKFRLFPNRTQKRELETTLETHRRLYNSALDERQFCYDTAGDGLSFAFQSGRFTILRRSNLRYQRINASSGHQTLRRLDKAFKGFFRRVKAGEKPGFPRFKGRDRFDSWTYNLPTGGGARLVAGKLRLQFIGDVRVKLHRPLEGTIKTIQVKREDDKWFAIFSCEVDCVPLEHDGPSVGIDVGLESFLTTSDGDHEPNPRHLKEALPELRRRQRTVARRKKGGSNRRNAVKHLRRTHVRVRNLRCEHHHKTALKLVRRYGFIAVENLTVKNMLRNHRLAQSIQDAGWSQFLGILRHKAESAGAQFVEVDPRGTSQTCTCGADVKKDLRQRWHDCPECGLSLHRDHVSAKVILARGLVKTLPAGHNVAGCRKRAPRSRQLLLLK